MNKTLLSAALALVGTFAQAADPPQARYVTDDHSTASLIDKATVASIWKEGLPEAKLVKLYPPAKWGFLSQVEGGMAGPTCVVTARVVLLPRTSPTRRLVWEPAKTSTAFDAKPGADAAQCSRLAADTLRQALASLVSGLVK